LSLGSKPEHDPEGGRGLERSTGLTEEETWLTPELRTISRLSAPAWKNCAESASGRMMQKRMCDPYSYRFVTPMAIRYPFLLAGRETGLIDYRL
jgi:hypothetical protein